MIAEPTRHAASTRLTDFVPKAASQYTMWRNHDVAGHPHVSVLSPYVRHRILTEPEVLRAVLAAHPFARAEKFIAEVYWRTYWKGWLEMRPAVWQWYQTDLQAAQNRIQTESGLRQDWEAACKGETGIDCFDHWAKELVETGYLHNHARMWFASIWIFTLRLPWTLGADFFLRHLLDGDPASNTLSWRWVGGLQTKGKTYLATADNIAKFTAGRFQPTGLAQHAVALTGSDHPAPAPLSPDACPAPDVATGLLLTHEDLQAGFAAPERKAMPRAALDPDVPHGPLLTAEQVIAFRRAALQDAAPDAQIVRSVAALITWAQEHGLSQIITPYAPVGPVQRWLNAARPELAQAGVTLHTVMRPYDAQAWPHATKGFFAFRKQIPQLITML